MSSNYKYDIALSFAEEDRAIAHLLEIALKAQGITKVYYYPNHTDKGWGRDLAKHLAKIYEQEARYAIVLLSKHYFDKPFTKIEYTAMQRRVIQEAPAVYMLPVVIGNVKELGKPELGDLHFLTWNHNSEQIASDAKKLLGKSSIAIQTDDTYKPYRSFFANDNYSTALLHLRKILIRIPWGWITIAGTAAMLAVYGISIICLPHKNEKIALPGGSFIMGAHSGRAVDMPAHTAMVKAFVISSTEVTISQYRKYCDSMHLSMPVAPGYTFTEDCPVVNITWQEAVDYCKWVGGRLPTELEWEYAAFKNGNITDRYSGGNNINKAGYYETNSAGKAHPVAQKCGGKLNLHDMSGNAAEWCADWYAPYSSIAQTNPQNTDSSSGQKVVRGGHYASHVKPDPADNQLRITYRSSEDPAARKPYIGFRVVWDK